MTRWIPRAAAVALLALTLCLYLTAPSAADAPPWPASSVVYCVFPSLFSPRRNLPGVTAQLPRLKELGASVVWLMPVTPVGRPINGHPAFGSPYSVHDYYAVNPDYGTEADLQTLVSAAHRLGLKVILDEVLNHTSWDNPLITQHPDFYVHTDGDPKNSASIRQAFNYGDVAQLNYANGNLRAYMIGMLQFWLTHYSVDGFRFDSADNPGGPNRLIPADFWQELGEKLRQTRPDVLLLGECETPDLALKPFSLDYGWRVYDALRDAANGGDASHVRDAWAFQMDFPPGMLHMSLQDNWDKDRDLAVFAGAGGAQAAAVFNLTVPGVPLIYNGMEVGNAGGSVNPHTPIDWANGDPRFPPLYHQLTALRRDSPALQQGAMTWLDNSAPAQVLTYTRSGGGQEYLVEINLSTAAARGTVQAAPRPAWTEVRLTGSHGAVTHVLPPQVSLQPKEYAIFKCSLPRP